VAASQILLGVFEKFDERILGTFVKLLRRDADIKAVAPINGRPSGDELLVGDLDFKVQTYGGGRRLIGDQALAHRVRGIPLIPHSSALWVYPTGVGGIRSTAQARCPA